MAGISGGGVVLCSLSRARGALAVSTRDRTKGSASGMLDKRLRAHISQGLAPIGKGLESAGVSANFLTVVGLVFSVITAFLIAAGELRFAVIGLIASGFVDLLDGAVARRSGQASPRGAFFDSVTD